LHAALESAAALQLAITDEASAMELAGHPVQLVPGSARNLKVTLPGDLQLATWYLEGSETA
jgi:2-C-methyl-D-erythritol 4-phosphate cytidylyltransferase